MLSEQSVMACEGKLSLVECYKALKMVADGKAPGNDGLTAVVYGQHFKSTSRISLDFLQTNKVPSCIPMWIMWISCIPKKSFAEMAPKFE